MTPAPLRSTCGAAPRSPATSCVRASALAPRTASEIARQTSEVIHCAASVSFDLPLPEARAINAAGVRRVGQLAELCGILGDGLTRFAHVSTAYVAGNHDGAFAEDDPYEGAGFRNTYEQTKYEGEQVLRAGAAEMPLQIIRPSIVVGNRHEWLDARVQRSLLAAADVLARSSADDPGALAGPGRRRARRLRRRRDPRPPGCPGRHVPPRRGRTRERRSARSSTWRRAAFGVPEPELVSPETVEADVDTATLTDAQRRVLDRARVYFPYFGLRVRFDDRQTRAVLDPMGVRNEPLHHYFDALMDYAQRARGAALR